MINQKINSDLVKLISKLDITVEMYKQAKERYKILSDIFMDTGIEADFYPQGSFRLGTIIRPLIKGVESEFDLDIVAEMLLCDKENSNPKSIKMSFYSILSKYPQILDHLLPESDRCWTLSYKENNFKLDIVPSVHETQEYIDSLIGRGVNIRFASYAIAITDKNDNGDYDWARSNPKGYAQWFEEINQPYLDANEKEIQKAFLEHRAVFATVEEIPPMLKRSALQRVIQILKYHRDKYFSDLARSNEKNWEYRPASVIITTLCAKVAQMHPATDDVFELLQHISGELREYSVLQNETDSLLFESRRLTDSQKSSFIKRSASKWSIKNPVNPDDDYTDYWTTDNAKWFFKWLDAVAKDFSDLIDTQVLNETKYFAVLKSSFGTSFIENVFEHSKIKSPVIITEQTKPYRCGYVV